MPGASNDGGEDSPGGVITGEAGLAHAGAIVNAQSGNVLVTHLEGSSWGLWSKMNLSETRSNVDFSLRLGDGRR